MEQVQKQTHTHIHKLAPLLCAPFSGATPLIATPHRKYDNNDDELETCPPICRNVGAAMKILHLLLPVSLCTHHHMTSMATVRGQTWNSLRGTGGTLFEVWGALQVLRSFKSSFIFSFPMLIHTLCGLLKCDGKVASLGKTVKENSLKPIGVHSVKTAVKDRPILKTWDVLILSEWSDNDCYGEASSSEEENQLSGDKY